MFEDIITKKEINFNEIENKVYEFVCKIGCNIIKEMLESMDDTIKLTRPNEMRNKGKRKNSIKTIMFENKEYDKISTYIEELKYETGGEEKEVKKLEKLKKYLSKDLERYTDIIELPKAPKGIEYRNMGTMESQIFTIFSKRFKGRKSFSKKGATNLAKVSALFKEQKNNIKIDEIEKMGKEDPYEDYVEKYIKELEKKYKESYDAHIATRGKTKEGIKEEHTIKNYNVNEIIEPNSIRAIKDIIKFKNNSEMTCWPTFFRAHKSYRSRKHK